MRSSARAEAHHRSSPPGSRPSLAGRRLPGPPVRTTKPQVPAGQPVPRTTHAGPTDRVLVWGNVPEIYWASGKRPATRSSRPGSSPAWSPAVPGTTPRSRTPTRQRGSCSSRTSPPTRRAYILDTASSGIRGAQYYTIARYSSLGTHRVPGLRLRRSRSTASGSTSGTLTRHHHCRKRSWTGHSRPSRLWLAAHTSGHGTEW